LRGSGGGLVVATERSAAAERLAMLGRLAAGLAHEIRNPLGSISGSAEMLREAPGLGDDDKRLLNIISGEAARLNNLVSDMMDLARPRKPEPEDVDVAALAREVVALAARSERSGAGDVGVRYAGPDAPVFARCDGAQMRQVVWNLVRNAVQASAAGKAVVVRVEEDGERIRLSVSDEGPGIDADAAANIFDAFYTTRSHGAGIGLAVVRRIIDDHAPMGATIRVRSTTQAKGATFEVGLARAKSTGTKDATTPAAAAVPATPPDPPVLPGANVRSQ
jgi:signal transduction histidine kinase